MELGYPVGSSPTRRTNNTPGWIHSGRSNPGFYSRIWIIIIEKVTFWSPDLEIFKNQVISKLRTTEYDQ